jgi:hypothetical protein
MIDKLVFKHDKRSQLVFSIVGTIIGLVMILLSVQIYMDISTVLNTPSIIGEDFLVLNKEVSMFDAGNYTDAELEDIKAQKFITDMAPVEGNRFESFVVANIGPKASFNTLMPLISIPDAFIDNLTPDFQWSTEEKEVPVIVPTSFFNSYNFGIAEASKSPKVTKELMTNLKPKLRIGRKEWYDIRIVAFSDRFSDGVIVPKSFLDYGNEFFAVSDVKKMNRIVIGTPNAKNPALSEYIERHSYVTNLEKIRGGKITETMNVLLPVILAVASVIVILSLLTFIQNAQLMLASSEYEIGLLGLLGYKYRDVSGIVMKKFNRLFTLVILLALPLSYMLKWLIDKQFEHELGIDIGLGVSWATIISGCIVYGVFYVVQLLMIRSAVKKEISAS